MRFILLTVFLFSAGCSTCLAQQPRLTDSNFLSWFVYAGTHKVSDNWAIRTEYQWRRVNGLSQPQQNLARLGIIRTLSDRIEVSAGYTNFQSFRYGTYPEVTARPEPEHRIYEDITLTDQLGRFGLEHRIRLEQRWLGNRDQSGQGPVESWAYQNRIRYQLALEFPLQGPTIDAKELYLNAFDELFMGFGRNVADNVFNQNRLSVGLGYLFTKNAKLELNYQYQIRQHAQFDTATDRSVVELNNGFRLNMIYNLDFQRPSVISRL